LKLLKKVLLIFLVIILILLGITGIILPIMPGIIFLIPAFFILTLISPRFRKYYENLKLKYPRAAKSAEKFELKLKKWFKKH
jgi:uncharacterized membrane protein YbaN (DUF454 family)